ncbi:MAG: hypothetical protein ABI868_12790 [Acidobacteriota bacterium]
MRKAIAWSAGTVVLCALAGGFYLVGPPAAARAQRLDSRRETDLQDLRRAIDLYWTRNSRLPDTLDALTGDAGTNIDSRDPETAKRYGYGVKSAGTYELCAGFARDSQSGNGFWSHGPGRRCFMIEAKTVRP